MTTNNGYTGPSTNDLQLSIASSSLDVDDSEGNAASTAGVQSATPALTSARLDVATASQVQITTQNDNVNKIIPANGNFYKVGEYTFASIDDSNVLKSLVLVNYATPAVVAPGGYSTVVNGTPVLVNGVALNAQNGVTVRLEDELGNVIATSSISSNGTVVFDPLNYVLPYGASKKVIVKVKSDLGSISNGTETNKNVNLALLHPGATIILPGGSSTAQTLIESSTNSSINATASYSNTPLLSNHYVRKTKLTFADVTNTNTAVLVAGSTRTIFKTNVTADSAGAVNLYSLAFNVVAGGTYTVPSSYSLYVDGTQEGTCVGTPVICTLNVNSSNGYTINPSQTAAFELRATPSATMVAGDSLSTTIEEGTTLNYATLPAAVAASAVNTVIWSDNSELPVSLATTAWFTDSGIEVLPTNSRQFVQN